MKIIISPSKEKKIKDYNYQVTDPLFKEKANYLINQLSVLSLDQIKRAYKCSDKIAEKVKQDFLKFNEERYPSISFFNGIQYKYISVETLKSDELNFLLENLYIADSLYGILRASDLISEYRLDYNTKVPFFSYDYYRKEINSVIDEKIINLCSKEFSKNIDNKKLYTINFIQEKKGVKKSYSTDTKIARGLFVRYIAEIKSVEVNRLKQFNYGGYIFIEEGENYLTFEK